MVAQSLVPEWICSIMNMIVNLAILAVRHFLFCKNGTPLSPPTSPLRSPILL